MCCIVAGMLLKHGFYDCYVLCCCCCFCRKWTVPSFCVWSAEKSTLKLIWLTEILPFTSLFYISINSHKKLSHGNLHVDHLMNAPFYYSSSKFILQAIDKNSIPPHKIMVIFIITGGKVSFSSIHGGLLNNCSLEIMLRVMSEPLMLLILNWNNCVEEWLHTMAFFLPLDSSSSLIRQISIINWVECSFQWQLESRLSSWSLQNNRFIKNKSGNLGLQCGSHFLPPAKVNDISLIYWHRMSPPS